MIAAPLPSQCPHCGAGRASIFADADGFGCFICGYRFRDSWAMANPQPQVRKIHRKRSDKRFGDQAA